MPETVIAGILEFIGLITFGYNLAVWEDYKQSGICCTIIALCITLGAIVKCFVYNSTVISIIARFALATIWLIIGIINFYKYTESNL